MRKLCLITMILIVLTPVAVTAQRAVARKPTRSYSTRFLLDEDPISEGGKWINGAKDGTDWHNVIARNGRAFGAVSTGAYTDPTALLTGTWGRNQTVKATVFSKNQTEKYYQEVEIRLRSTLTPHHCTGYEVFWRCLKTANAYAEIVRWNGKVGDWTSLKKLTGARYGVKDGDLVKATIAGNVIKGFINDVEVISATDDTYKEGNPGIGFNYGVEQSNGDFGFSSYEVDTYDEPHDAEKTYAPMPWHLVDTWWDIGKHIPFESLAVDVTISDDVPSSVNLYIAPIGLGHLSKTPFYGGIQTHADGYTRRDQNLRQIGPGFLFSMWGERSQSAVRPSEGGFFQSSGHEGDFVSVRRAFGWKKGKYTYRLSRMDQQTIDGKPYTWVGAFVYSHDNDENVFVGALRFKGENLILDRQVANFIEIYGRQRPVADIPKVAVTFSPPIVNGVVAKNPAVKAIYPKGVPDYAAAAVQDGSLVIKVGHSVEGRQKREAILIGSKEKSISP